MKKMLIAATWLLIWVTSCNREDMIIGINEDIHHDDFRYRVTSVEKRKSLSYDKHILTAKGTYYIVTFAVFNDAMRVQHDWNNQIAYVRTGDKTIENDPWAQQVLDQSDPFGWQQEYHTPQGTVQHTKLVFDVPQHATPVWLQVRGYMLMGDVLNLNRFKRIKIRL